MNASNETVNWKELIELFNTTKWLYALCEEIDPDFCTNLQPLNEFRAALDHLMRIMAIQNLTEYADKSAVDESKKLRSHLRRALFDISDMLSMHYRNKIVDMLKKYSVDEIQQVMPTYYSTIKPRFEQIYVEIAALRTERRFNTFKSEDAIDEYPKVIEELMGYHDAIVVALPSLNEIKRKNRLKNLLLTWIIPISGVAIGILGWFVH